MGKEAAIKSLSKVIGNVAIHKTLIKNTNKLESIDFLEKDFLEKEVLEYGGVAIKKSSLYNWNDFDKELIKKESLRNAFKIKERKYKDVEISLEEIEKEISEVMKEVGL